MRAVFDVWHDLTSGSRVGAELVGAIIRRGGQPSLPQETLQQALGGQGVAARLHDLIKDVSVLVNRPPRPVHTTTIVTTTVNRGARYRGEFGAYRLRRRAYASPNLRDQRRTVS